MVYKCPSFLKLPRHASSHSGILQRAEGKLVAFSKSLAGVFQQVKQVENVGSLSGQLKKALPEG